MAQTILIIEDNASFRKAVSGVLSRNSYSVLDAATGKAGIAAALEKKPDLIILDLVLPGLQGTEICQQLKANAETASIPILILTGNDRDGQDIACLDGGADDYLTKPVKAERLVAHCQMLLRRTGAVSAKSNLSLGAMDFDYGRKIVIVSGKEYPQLTPKEFGMLYELARQSPQPLDRTVLYQRVWGSDPPSEGSLKTVDVHARRIRLKLGWDQGEWLVFIAGRGYCLVPRPKS